MKTGLYFGSFNPIHIGHLAVANYMLAYTSLDEVWFVVSPQNPFKKKESLLDDYLRLDMVNIAIADQPGYKACDIEFRLPRPSYTIDTLVYLHEKYPRRDFALIMGTDSLETLHRWKNYEQILQYHNILVYPRNGYAGCRFDNHPQVCLVDAPQIGLSSSFIRQGIAEGLDLPYFLPTPVYKFIQDMNLYKALSSKQEKK